MKKQPLNIESYAPPSAITAEEAVLGAMLIDKSSVDEVLMILRDEQVFYKNENRLIFKAIKELNIANVGIDLITVSNKLRANGDEANIGGVGYLIKLTQTVASTAHIEHHSRIILQQWVKREVITMAAVLTRSSFSETIDIFDLLADAEKGLDRVNEMLESGGGQIDFKAALQQVVDRVEMLSNQKENELSGITTGFRTIDKFTGGWQPADLIIIAARPGMGKTALILKNLLEISLTGAPVGMFSLEMSIVQLAARLVAINSNFHLSQLIKKGFEKDEYFLTLINVQNAMNSLQIHIDDSAGLSVHQLQMKARMWKRKYGIKALFVDYIQLMNGDSKLGGNREQEISTITRKLKQLAKELNIPVIALSQLSRAVETRGGDKRPRLSDLRESGAIEQDADAVIFIYRPEYYGLEPDSDLSDLGANTELAFAKYRTGSLETKGLWWQGDKTKFMDVEDKYIHQPIEAVAYGVNEPLNPNHFM